MRIIDNLGVLSLENRDDGMEVSNLVQMREVIYNFTSRAGVCKIRVRGETLESVSMPVKWNLLGAGKEPRESEQPGLDFYFHTMSL